MKAFYTSIYRSPYLLLVLAVLFWSGNFILGRAMRLDIPPVALAFWRWALASCLATALALPHLRQDWPKIRQHRGVMMLLSFLGIAVFNTFVYLGLQWTIAVNALLMQSVMPVLIVMISYILFQEKITLRQGVGVGISLLGALMIIGQGSITTVLALDINRGDLFVLLAVVCYAFYSVVLRKRPAIHPLSFISVTFITGTVMLLPFYLVEVGAGRVLELDVQSCLSIGYVAIFPSIVSYLCFNRGVEIVGPNKAGMFIHLLPVFGSIMAIIFLGESLRWYHGVGVVFIGTGIFLATRVRRS